MLSNGKFSNDPFKVEGTIDPTTEIGQEVLSQPPATRAELWSYYLYYSGNNGWNFYQFIPTLLQLMSTKGGFNPDKPGHQPCSLSTNDGSACNVPWNGAANGIPVFSVTMYANAISFAAQFLIFITFGSLADYGRFNFYILIISTLISCASQILPIIFLYDDGHSWPGMMVLNIVGLVSYGATLIYYAAAFPTLSDNLPLVRNIRADPNVSVEDTLTVVERWRNHVSAVSTAFSNIGFLVISAIFTGVSFIPWSKGPFFNNGAPVFGNTLAYYCVASLVAGAYMLINAIPYFMCRPIGRRGPPLPKNEHHLTIGWKNSFKALKEAKKYRYLFLYLISYFMFSDGVNAISNFQTFLQNSITNFSATQTAGMGLLSAVTSIIGCFFFLYLQKYFNFSTKTILMTIIILTSVIPIWGCFGIRFDDFGIKTNWELWVLAAWSGLFTGPIWAFQQSCFAELVPRNQENLFFGFFGLVSKASSWIAPTVIGVVTQQTSAIYTGWPVIVALFVLAIVTLWFVDMEAAKLELLHMEIHQELIHNMAAAAMDHQDRSSSPSANENEKVPIIMMELSTEGGSEAGRNY
ncbi:autophagy-related protein 22-like protein [Absidia repens]|uniref:Autophagy-related protein n=1 Tax=Absidia repens TaxID=90262 RepID=A0A1X2ICQ5_9FUNG|nr:autophagy-related protein 22-like protein [Absidia repens]